jgi:hypothetical protein
MKTILCTYCGKHFPAETMTPLYEIDKPNFVSYYCENCTPIVRANIYKMPWLRWGRKGEVN